MINHCFSLEFHQIFQLLNINWLFDFFILLHIIFSISFSLNELPPTGLNYIVIHTNNLIYQLISKSIKHLEKNVDSYTSVSRRSAARCTPPTAPTIIHTTANSSHRSSSSTIISTSSSTTSNSRWLSI